MYRTDICDTQKCKKHFSESDIHSFALFTRKFHYISLKTSDN